VAVVVRPPDGSRCDSSGFGRVLRNLLDARAHLLGAGGDRLKILADGLGGFRDDVGLSGCFFGVGGNLLAGPSSVLRSARHLHGIGANRDNHFFEAAAHLVDGYGEVAEFVVAADFEIVACQIASRDGFCLPQHRRCGGGDATRQENGDKHSDSDRSQGGGGKCPDERPAGRFQILLLFSFSCS